MEKTLDKGKKICYPYKEVILLKDGGAEDEERLKWMIQQVNQEIVDAEEILSDSLYYYDFGQKTLKRIP